MDVSRTTAPVTVVLLLLSAAAPRLAHGADFRIVTEVFASGQPAAVSKNLTLFHHSFVYDYLLMPPQSVTIFDQHRGRFVLIDSANKVQTEITSREVNAFNEQLRATAEAHKDPLLRFLANPQFKISNPEENVLVMGGPNLSYRVTGVDSNDPQVLRQYLEFSDWYARLNTMVNPGSPPPYMRIAINQTLAKKRWIPTEVELSVTPAVKGAKPMRLTSRHTLEWKISAEDLRWIDETGEELATYKKIGFQEFQQMSNSAPMAPAAVAKKPATAKR